LKAPPAEAVVLAHHDDPPAKRKFLIAMHYERGGATPEREKMLFFCRKGFPPTDSRAKAQGTQRNI